MKKKVLLAAVLALALSVAPIGKAGMSIATASSNNTVSGNNTVSDNDASNDSDDDDDDSFEVSGSGSGAAPGTYDSTVQENLEAKLPENHFTAVENYTAIKLNIAVGVSTSNDDVREAAGLKDNESVKVVVGVKSSDSVSESEKSLINNAVQEGVKIYSEYLDLSMIKMDDNSSENIHQLNSEITFVITAPSEYDGNNGDFAIIRIHDGVATVLPDLDGDATTITFKTDRFSTYAIAYGDKGAFDSKTDNDDTDNATDTATDVKDSVPKTGDTIPTAVPAMAALGLAAAAVVLSKKKEA